ncbi:hypothetical protein [Nocardia gipuzkoensis]|uniref:hypothetical protein n=1 Tax=Nocardia gipuzkoensis TaxID=2749991 RepID=UPI00237DCFE7|nr:hypothetical protein [Nocardia gipuzkoensis]MDE1674714.1 hypothetical protein [Nocardia gipuzkoensis]
MTKRTVTIEVSRYLSTPRLTPYLNEANGDLEFALALYHWNMQLASAFQEVLGTVEIVVRNAIDEQLKVWNLSRGADRNGVPYTDEWALRPATPLAGLLRNALANATDYAHKAKTNREPGHARKNAPVCHDDVLSQLSFSVWKKLLPPADPANAGRRNLWNNALVHAFPRASGNSINQILALPAEDMVYRKLDNLVGLRNRVAHMEPLLTVNVPARLSDSLGLLAYVSPPTRDWCAGISRVTEVNNARPKA